MGLPENGMAPDRCRNTAVGKTSYAATDGRTKPPPLCRLPLSRSWRSSESNVLQCLGKPTATGLAKYPVVKHHCGCERSVLEHPHVEPTEACSRCSDERDYARCRTGR